MKNRSSLKSLAYFMIYKVRISYVIFFHEVYL